MRAMLFRLVLLTLILATPALAEKGVDCTLSNAELIYPPDGATWYVVGNFGSVDVPLIANTDCQEETSRVAFQLTEEGDAGPTTIGTDTSAPYESEIRNLRGSSLDQTLTVTLVAQPRDTTDDDIVRTADITLVSDGTDIDEDGNGLPDDPFIDLNRQGDRWHAGITLAGETAQLLQTVTALYGDDFLAKQVDTRLGRVELTLESNENPGQSIEVAADTDLLDDDEQGMLLVGMAPTLSSLLGAQTADDITREPAGTFDGEGQYLVIALIVSDNNGQTWRLANDSRIGSRPFTVRFNDLPLASDVDYVLAYHRINVEDGANGLTFTDTTGAWTSLSSQTVDTDADTIGGLLSTHAVVAPYFLVDNGTEGEGEGTPEGEGEGTAEGEGEGEGGSDGGGSPILQLPTFFWIEALIGLAFGILALVDGGVGGGGPCFIATAAYGTPLATEIEVLRVLRDDILLNNSLGTAFVDTYYRISPPIADLIAAHPLLAAATRVALVPIVVLVKIGMAAPWLLLTIPVALTWLHRRKQDLVRHRNRS